MKDLTFTGRTAFLIISFFIGLSRIVPAQSQESAAIYLEAEKGTFSKELPHGKPFTVVSSLPKTFGKSELHWWLAVDGKCEEPEESQFAIGAVEPNLDKNLKRKVSFRVDPLKYSASYCFSLHVYQDWNRRDNDALEDSILKILKDSLKAKDVFPHRVIRRDLGPLAGYWVNSKGRTLQLHTAEWFDTTHEYQVLKAEAMVYLRNYHVVHAAAQRKRNAIVYFKQNNNGSFLHDLRILERAMNNLYKETQNLPHSFNPKETKQEEDFLDAERHAASFEEMIERKLIRKDCSRGGYSQFCHLLFDLKKDSKVFEKGFKNLTTAFKRMKHAWSALEVKLEVFTEQTHKLLTNPIFLSGEGHVNADTPQGKRHISFSFGAMTALGVYGDEMFKLEDMALLMYTTMNFYFSPVDTTIPLSIDGGFARRFSLNIGMTISEISDQESEVDGVVMNRGLVTGVGYRLSDNLKVGLGMLWYKKVPVRGGPTEVKRLELAPYLSVAMDLDLIRLFFKEAKKTQAAAQ